MNYLWNSDDSGTDTRIMRFLAGADVRLDQLLLPYDIEASVAHAQGLQRIGILSDAELIQIETELNKIAAQLRDGSLQLDERFEDGHSALESWLSERLGETGRKIHTGRSRNDQVLVATRLYLRDVLERLETVCREAAASALQQARAHPAMPMPGYTHLQRAVVSSVEVWFAGFAEAFIDNARLARVTRDWINASPLGTAAGYGVNLPLDRDYTCQALGFERLQLNPVYAQNSRGRFELQGLTALGQALLETRRLAWDLSLFTTAEFGFVTLPDIYTTGSSIMPNKRNPDLVELLRAAYAPVAGAINEISQVLSLPGGYQRDLQATKEPLIRAASGGLQAMELVPRLLAAIRFDPDRLSQAIEPAMFATDRAIELSAGGMAFRDAYHAVRQELGQDSGSAPSSIAARISAGAAGNPGLEILEQRLRDLG